MIQNMRSHCWNIYLLRRPYRYVPRFSYDLSDCIFKQLYFLSPTKYLHMLSITMHCGEHTPDAYARRPAPSIFRAAIDTSRTRTTHYTHFHSHNSQFRAVFARMAGNRKSASREIFHIQYGKIKTPTCRTFTDIGTQSISGLVHFCVSGWHMPKIEIALS